MKTDEIARTILEKMPRDLRQEVRGLQLIGARQAAHAIAEKMDVDVVWELRLTAGFDDVSETMYLQTEPEGRGNLDFNLEVFGPEREKLEVGKAYTVQVRRRDESHSDS